ncbi:uncharacterized protein LOC132044786 isoform X2 [Lycium ferocissimum]|uniref:uncharacterized protein LOC132044786 isoform X2 n=1 Tax=Lycium ferocissimum TaxID=112874 RepID=UPI002815E645|nr:uncharacterized protein LOC132044786 isoform X2 [Lycium ferocissimum]
MKMLEFRTVPHLFSLNPKVVPPIRHVDFLIPNNMLGRKCASLRMGCGLGHFSDWTRTGRCAVLLGVGDTEVSTSEFEDFSVTTRGASGSNELKISVNVSGGKTQEIFDRVFSRMVEDAQPIPGFQRVKGGKTPNIPREILLEILGYSKVYKQVIKKIINSTISKYVEKCTALNGSFIVSATYFLLKGNLYNLLTFFLFRYSFYFVDSVDSTAALRVVWLLVRKGVIHTLKLA